MEQRIHFSRIDVRTACQMKICARFFFIATLRHCYYSSSIYINFRPTVEMVCMCTGACVYLHINNLHDKRSLLGVLNISKLKFSLSHCIVIFAFHKFSPNRQLFFFSNYDLYKSQCILIATSTSYNI